MKDKTRLFNKYRPNFFKDIKGQDISVSYLKGLILTGNYKNVSEIILHSVIGGVSKTTLAKIYAKAINCDNIQEDGEPCNTCKSCVQFNNDKYIDYLEYNGAEYNTVDSVSSIIELAQMYPCNPNKYRVIVFNELQRSSKQAMTKFLDLLEFGSNKTIFIFTTTEMHNILQPLKSRCFNIEISSMSSKDTLFILEDICKKEDIEYKIDALIKIVDQCGGSARDAIRILDLCYQSYGNVNQYFYPINLYDTIANVFSAACLPNFNNYEAVCSIISNDLYKDLCKVLIDLESFFSGNNDLKWVNKNTAKICMPILKNEIFKIIKVLVKYKPSNHEDLYLLLKTLHNSNIKNLGIQNQTNKGRRFVESDNIKQAIDLFGNYGFSKLT